MILTYEDYNSLLNELFKKINIKDSDNNFTKRKKIFDYMLYNITYDYDNLYSIWLKNIRKKRKVEIQDVLIEHKGICNSIATVYKLMLEKANIYAMCVCVKGHMINLVQNENNTFSFDDVTKGIMAEDFNAQSLPIKKERFLKMIEPKGKINDYFNYSLADAKKLGQGISPFKHKYLEKNIYWLPVSTIDYVYKLIGKKDYEYLQYKNNEIDDFGYIVSLPKQKLIKTYNSTI